GRNRVRCRCCMRSVAARFCPRVQGGEREAAPRGQRRDRSFASGRPGPAPLSTLRERLASHAPMPDSSTPLFFPQLGHLYQSLAPWAEALLRAFVGLALVPHGLRNTFGMWPSTGVRSHNLTELAQQLDDDGYRPGKFWAPAISITQLVGGPLLALGLFTRPAAFAVVVFLVVSNYERWRVGGYFWNRTGLEYTL